MKNLCEYLSVVYKEKFFEKTENSIYRDSNIDLIELNRLLDIVENDTNFSLRYDNRNYHSCEIEFSPVKITCFFNMSRKIYCEKRDDKRVIRLTRGIVCKIVIFDNNTIYEETTPRGQGERLVPITVKRIAGFYDLSFENPFAVCFFNYIFKYFGSKNPIYRDIHRIIESDRLMLIPMGFFEINEYHNIRELLLSKYKTATEIRYNWNKRNPNLSYLIIKSFNYVRPEQREKLFQIIDFPFDEVDIKSSYSYLSNVQKFLIWVLQNRCNAVDEKKLQIVRDYVYMCFTTHTKVNINFKSVKKIKEAHDELTQINYMKGTPVVKIKKDTIFKQLRNILPKEFEWIRTRKRLIEETVMQHHCVWSYANKINRDKCQIYSYVDSATGKRYTLEFGIRKGKYSCVQLYGVNNTYDETAKKIDKNVRDLIKKYNC